MVKLVHKFCYWWLSRFGFQIVNKAHLDSLKKELKRSRCNMNDSFEIETPKVSVIEICELHDEARKLQKEIKNNNKVVCELRIKKQQLTSQIDLIEEELDKFYD